MGGAATTAAAAPHQRPGHRRCHRAFVLHGFRQAYIVVTHCLRLRGKWMPIAVIIEPVLSLQAKDLRLAAMMVRRRKPWLAGPSRLRWASYAAVRLPTKSPAIGWVAAGPVGDSMRAPYSMSPARKAAICKPSLFDGSAAQAIGSAEQALPASTRYRRCSYFSSRRIRP